MRVGEVALRLPAFILALTLGVPALAQEGQELDESWSDAEGYDCQRLDNQPIPEAAIDWFERSLWANHCYIFQARAVRISSDGVRTLALSHDVQDGVEREVARFLDGPPVVFERRGRIGRAGWSGEGGQVTASPTAIVEHIEKHYRLSLGGEERIAGRRTVRLDIEPLDEMRYGHRMWLDKRSALPLKQVLLNADNRVLETFQLTELDPPSLHQGRVNLDEMRSPPTTPWRPGWLPDGFTVQPVKTTSHIHDVNVGHRLFSDGLSSISLFVEPIDGQHPLLAQGMHRLGISFAAVRHVELAGKPLQVVVMGETPPQVLQRVAEAVEWRPDMATEPAGNVQAPQQ